MSLKSFVRLFLEKGAEFIFLSSPKPEVISCIVTQAMKQTFGKDHETGKMTVWALGFSLPVLASEIFPRLLCSWSFFIHGATPRVALILKAIGHL